MTEYVIDLQPKLIEMLNQKLIEILKLPKELLSQYTSNPYINADEQKLLKKAADAYQSENYSDAIAFYKQSNVLIGKKNGVNINNNNENSQWSVLVQYLLSKCLLKSKKFMDLLEAQKILLQLEKSEAQKYPMIYYALAEFYLKLFCFQDAECEINKGLAILNGGNGDLINYYIPLTNDIIIESTNQELSKQLLNLKKKCTGWHRADALCFMTNCRSNSEHHLSGRNIYFNSPAYNGMVIVVCDNINSCNITFHSACWKVQKKELSPGKKMSDRDFLLWKCFTPNCERNSTPSKIERIEIHNKDEVKHIEIPPEKRDRIRHTPSKGAIHKQKIKSDSKHSKQKISPAKKLACNEPNDGKKSNGIDDMKLQLSNLIKLRNNNFNIDKNDDWRPDLQYYGNIEFESKYDKIPPEPDCSDVTRKVASLKSFLYSYFYRFILKNGPVKIDSLQETWDIATDLVGNCETLLYDLHCANIAEFLIQSSKFTIISDYLCTPETIPETYALVRNNACTSFRYLMDSNEDDPQIVDEDEKLAKFMLADAEENLLNTYSSSLIDINDNNLPASTAVHENNILSNNNNEKLSCPSQIIIDKKEIEETTKIMTNGDIAYKNIDLSSSNSKNSIDIKKMSEAITKDKAEKSIQLINSLRKQLEVTNEELKAKNIQLTDMKMSMLRLSLDSQFMTINISIQNRLSHFQSQYAVIGKIQNILMNMLGTQLPLNHCDWAGPIEELQKISNILVQTYNEKLVEINSKERCKDIDDVRLNVPNLPTLPNHNISELLQAAFQMYYSHFQRLFATLKPIPNPFPSQFIHNPSIFVPSFQHYPQYHNFFPQQQSTQLPIPPLISQFPLIRTNLPTQEEAKMPNANNEQAEKKSELNNIPTEQMQETQSKDVEIDEKQIDDVTTISEDKNQPNGIPDKDQFDKSKLPSMDLLLNLLRCRNKGVLEYDLLWCVNQVRKMFNDSLTGVPLSEIINQTERLLIHREKLQLANYSENSNNNSDNVSRNSSNHQPQRKTSVSSTSSCISTNSITKGLTSKKNPWNTINDTCSTWNATDIQEECVICFEMLRSATKTLNSTYTLRCKHTFHKKCINNWFKENRSCPTCRKHSTMDDEFPPL